MRQFKTIYAQNRPVLSIELFPPKTEAGQANLDQELLSLVTHRPAFISVTYGAGGSTRDKTLSLVQDIRTRFGAAYGLEAVPHFTCVGSSRQDIRAYVELAVQQGAHNMVVLRGDPPAGMTQFQPAPDGLRHADELVAFIRAQTGQLDLAVAGYPEGHVECRDLDQDVVYLKRKVDAGASVVLTQLFYDNADFFRFRDVAARQGISVPIVPGIMPITRFSQIQRITGLCGARIPDELALGLMAHADGSEDQQQAGVDYAIEQCRDLLEHGVPGLHIFTLNKGHATSRLVDALGAYFER